MTGADIVICAIVLLSAAIGLMRGLVREVLSLAVWAGAFVLALGLAPRVAPELEGIANDPTVRHVIAFAVVFLTTLIVGGLLQWMASRLIATTGLTGTDRLLGFLFGALRGAVVCIVGLIAIRPFASDYAWWQSAIMVPPLLAFERDLVELMGLATGAARDLMNGS